LKQNYPNPFNPTTTIEFQIPTQAHVELKVFDLLGREVATLVNEEMIAGKHQRIFDGSPVASGTYFVRLRAGTETKTMGLLLLR
jgi:glucuronoarabinoxylan endo-1,4-beta-xylanase